ncbi:MAG: hypothetical protein U1E42_03110 [Rhodospirillales bacterium]
MLRAENWRDLLATLSHLDVFVPPRSRGRSKEHTERYCIAYSLSTLAYHDVLRYPISLSKRERPDLLLTLGTTCIGIEITEAVPKNDAHKTAIRNENGPHGWHYISRYSPGEAKKTRKKLCQEIKDNEPGNGWSGDSVEREWAEAMAYFIGQKTDKLRMQYFNRFNEDWLLIYDNWPLPDVDIELAAQYLCSIAGSCEFSYVYILSGENLLEVSSLKWRRFEVKNLWTERQ